MWVAVSTHSVFVVYCTFRYLRNVVIHVVLVGGLLVRSQYITVLLAFFAGWTVYLECCDGRSVGQYQQVLIRIAQMVPAPVLGPRYTLRSPARSVARTWRAAVSGFV